MVHISESERYSEDVTAASEISYKELTQLSTDQADTSKWDNTPCVEIYSLYPNYTTPSL